MRKLFAFVLLLLVAGAGWATYSLMSPTGPAQQVFVEFKPGASPRRIAAELNQAGIIRAEFPFLLLHYVRRRTLKAGEYAFDHPATALEVYNRIARGDTYAIPLSVPEGFNLYDIAAAVERAGIDTQQNFLGQARSQTSLIRDLDPAAPSLEGYLYPETYRLPRKAKSAELLAMMVKRFRQEAQAIGLTSDFHRIVTLASLVEKEVAQPAERPLVASVFYNRLERNIPLATDPSVIYAALLESRYRGTIYQSDLQARSPYNTYKVAGLPPGPIASPGDASLKAALHPAQSDYLYFVSDAQGHSRFARTMEEHARNVQAYRQAVAAAPRPK